MMEMPVPSETELVLPEAEQAGKLRRVELKYVVTSAQAQSIREWACTHLAPDPHSGADTEGYQITSLYLDTPQLDVFHRRKDIVDRKHRVRQYGEEQTVWLETKRKRKNVVRKKRTPIRVEELPRLWGTETPEPEWAGSWFHQRLQQASLQPAALIRYERLAWQGQAHTGTVRLTLDRRIRGTFVSDWHQTRQPWTGQDLLPGAEILELKFNDILPPLFRQLLQHQSLSRSVFSKYRTTISLHQLSWEGRT